MLETTLFICLSQRPCGLSRESTVDHLLELRVRIPLRAWMSVSCERWVLSGKSLYDGPITRPEESYRLWCVTVCDLEASRIRRPWPALGCCTRRRQSWLPKPRGSQRTINICRVRGTATGWGTVLQAWSSRVQFPRIFGILHCLNASGRTMALGSTQSLT